MHLKIIYNPSAGRGRARRHIRAVREHLSKFDAHLEFAETHDADELVRVAAESSRGGFDRVVVCGGDGTVHLALREFDLERGVLGVIPLGSGDDFARVLEIPRGSAEACATIVNGVVREVDVALANGVRYVGVAGLGFDSEVAEFANQDVKFLRGSLVYLYSIFRVLPRFTPHRVRISSGRGWRDEEIMFAAIGNSRQYGGGIRITPDARIDDGQLDAVIVHKTSRFQLLKTLPRAYGGTHVKSEFVESVRSSEFHFESERSLAVYADGERVTTTPVSFTIAPQRLRVVVPRTQD